MALRIGGFFRVTAPQQRGIAVLTVILLLLTAATAIRDAWEVRRSATRSVVLADSLSFVRVGVPAGADTLFYFDPSRADSATFVRLGFSPGQARTIIRYRTAIGGRFYSEEHFSRCRAVSQDMYLRLKPYIRTAAPADAVPVRSDTDRVDINRASLERLRSHSALDDRLARRVFLARIRYGGFIDADQLVRVLPGDSAKVRAFSLYADFDPSALVRYEVNRDSETLLAEHPYISRPFARQIVSYRERCGRVPCYDTLKTLKYFPRSKERYLRFYLTFDTLENVD